jgi:hypothetical protein
LPAVRRSPIRHGHHPSKSAASTVTNARSLGM